MKKHITTILLLNLLFLTTLSAQESPIFDKGEKAPNVHHTGDIWLNHLSDADENFDYNVVVATSAANAKLDWHSHPAGQQLIITDGIGYYQERGKDTKIVKRGDIIICEPGVEHWHGSTPKTAVTYLAITGNKPTKWLESVNEEEYNNIKQPKPNEEAVKQQVMKLSKDKWQWMADKDIESLDALFHDQSVYVHMGGSWGKEKELEVIESGGIHYKQADIHEVSVSILGNTAILLNRITLLAVVGGNEVTNPFEVTEVYVKEEGAWKLASMSFTKLLTKE